MGRHALRGAVTAWLGLLALQAVVTRGGSGRVASAMSTVDALVQRALSSDVAAIPDRRAVSSATGATGYITPAQAAAAAKVAAAEPGVAAVLSPTGGLGGLGGLQQYTAGGGLPSGFLNNPALR
jgi:hypothetical protein